MFMTIVKKLRAWRALVREHELAWRDQIIGDADGLSPFQKSVMAALSEATDSGTLTTCKMPENYLRFDFSGAETFVFAYLDGVEVHGPRPWRAEHWDYPTPQELISDMLVAVQSNNSFKPKPLRSGKNMA